MWQGLQRLLQKPPWERSQVTLPSPPCSLSHCPHNVLTLTLPSHHAHSHTTLPTMRTLTLPSHRAPPAPLTHTCSPSPHFQQLCHPWVYAGGLLSRSSFRAGHQGQCVRPVDAGSQLWWTRPLHDWSDDEQILAAGAVLIARARQKVSVIAQVAVTDRHSC